MKCKFSDCLCSEIGCLDVKDIVIDSCGCLIFEVCDVLNSGSVGIEDEVIILVVDNVIVEVVECVMVEMKGKVLVINLNSMVVLGIEVVDV